MKTITNIQDYWSTINEITDRHEWNKSVVIRICSFGLFSMRPEDKSMVKAYFDRLKNFKPEKVQIAIGMSQFNPCKKECLDCYNKYCMSVKYTQMFLRQYDFLDVALVYDTHMKLFMIQSIDKSKCITDYVVGGINFGDSHWHDSAMHIEGKNDALVHLHDQVFYKARRFDFVPQLMPPEPNSEYGVIRFGKYKGRTWKEINIENPGYVAWAQREKLTVEL